MARKRMIDPSFWVDEKLGTCSRDERLLFMGLISNADDVGRLQGHPALLKSIIFPYDFDITPTDVEKLSQSLNQRQLIQIYQVNRQTYIAILNFLKHQTIKKPTPSKLPAPPVDSTDISFSEEVPHQFPTSSELVTPKRKEEKRKEEKGREGEENGKYGNSSPSSSASQICLILFEGEFGRPLSPLEIEEITDLENRFSFELVKEALKRAVAQGKRNIKYTQRILENWDAANLKTIQEVLDYENFAQNKRKSNTSKIQNPIPTPEDHVKSMELEIHRKAETINAAVTFIRFQLGANPPPDKAKEMALGYGEELVPDILSQLFGKENST